MTIFLLDSCFVAYTSNTITCFFTVAIILGPVEMQFETSLLSSGTVVEHNIFPSLLHPYTNESNFCGSSIKAFFTGKSVNVLFLNVP